MARARQRAWARAWGRVAAMAWARGRVAAVAWARAWSRVAAVARARTARRALLVMSAGFLYNLNDQKYKPENRKEKSLSRRKCAYIPAEMLSELMIINTGGQW